MARDERDPYFRRDKIASSITLTSEDEEIMRRTLTEVFEEVHMPKIKSGSVIHELKFLNDRLVKRGERPPTARELAAWFVNLCAFNIDQDAGELPEEQDQGYATMFDTATGMLVASRRILIAEKELKGETGERVDRELDNAPEWTHLTQVGAAEVILEEDRYSKKLAARIREQETQDPSGIVLFDDFISELESDQELPEIYGIKPSLSRNLVLLGTKHAREIYEAIYPSCETLPKYFYLL
ncbi:MAG: hypothetical protein M1450_02660 [Patescibacteria group bacterium]|nr:hypothetical protein [Patescibacteria group bacterium]